MSLMTMKITLMVIGSSMLLLQTLPIKTTASNEIKSEGRSGPTDAANNPTATAFDGLGDMFKGMGDLSGLMGSFNGARVIPGVGDTTAEKSGDGNKEREAGFMGVQDPMEFFKLMLDPMEFMGRLAKQFKLDRGEFTQAVARGSNFGLETALQPPMACVKIIEKVFVPDNCKLKFVCDMGHHLTMFKGQMPKFPDSYFEGASTAKALYDGASGRECQVVYDCKQGEGPKLKKEYAGLVGKGDQDSAAY